MFFVTVFYDIEFDWKYPTLESLSFTEKDGSFSQNFSDILESAKKLCVLFCERWFYVDIYTGVHEFFNYFAKNKLFSLENVNK